MYCSNCKKEMRKKPTKRKRAKILARNISPMVPRTIMDQYLEYAHDHPEIILNLLLF